MTEPTAFRPGCNLFCDSGKRGMSETQSDAIRRMLMVGALKVDWLQVVTEENVSIHDDRVQRLRVG